jgi:hypothetical protein
LCWLNNGPMKWECSASVLFYLHLEELGGY